MHRPDERRDAGFAMLFVFLLAGCIAISLYMELPRVVFEAQRSREQVLIDRGEQYQRAIQLYFRRFRVYPPNMEALESTNNIRFLRRRYKDPMTGEDEWRVIRGMPNGVFLDSLVHKPPSQSAKDGETAVADAAGVASALWQQRRPSDVTLPPEPGQQPADMANAEIPAEAVAGQQLDVTQEASPSAPDQQTGVQAGLAAVPVVGGALGIPVVPGMQPGMPSFPGGPPAPFGQPTIQPQGVPGAPIAPGSLPGQPTGAGNPALDMIRNMLMRPNPQGLRAIQVAASQQSTGPAGIAGVASKLEAEGIMVYNDRSKYNEWEFLYDPRLDVASMAQGQVPPNQQGQGGSQSGGFGRGGNQGGFGQGGNQGFGTAPAGRGGGVTPFPLPGFGGGRGGGIQPQAPRR